MDKSTKKSKKKLVRRILTVVLCVFLALIIVLGAAILAFMHKYNSTSFEKIDIVSRTDTYLPPEQPELALSPTDEPSSDSEGAAGDALETLPDEIYSPSGDSDDVPQDVYDGSKSFMDADAVSVYGGVPIYKVAQKDPNVENFLIVGTDARDVSQHRGLSDVMIVVSYNKSAGTVKLMSFLRDSYVPIEGYGWGKLNWAYIRYGIGSTINTINQCFDLDIQRFVVIDFNGTRNFIDYIGGVDVPLTAAEAQYMGVGSSVGTYHLDGSTALVHCRNRSLDSDFGRTRRQRDVVAAVISKMRSGIELSEVLGMLDHALKMVRTNIPFTTMVSLVSSVVTGGSISTESYNVPFSDAYGYGWINGTDSVVTFDFEYTKNRIHDTLY